MLTDTLIIYQMWSLDGPNNYKYNAMKQNPTPLKFISNKDSRTIASCQFPKALKLSCIGLGLYLQVSYLGTPVATDMGLDTDKA